MADLSEAIERARKRAKAGLQARQERTEYLRATMPECARLVASMRAAGLLTVSSGYVRLTENGQTVNAGKPVPDRIVPKIPGVPNDGPHVVLASGPASQLTPSRNSESGRGKRRAGRNSERP